MKFGRYLTGALAALALGACHPNDVNTKTVKERLDKGEIVEFTEPGSKLPSCKTSPDWTDIRMQNSERERIVLGKQQSYIAPGNRACYRIGSNVLLDGRKPAAGSVKIISLALARIDKVRADDLKGRMWNSKEEFNGYISGVKSRMGGNETGYVYIVSFVYLGGTAADEKVIKEKDTGPDYKETVADGETIDRCNSEWTDFTISPDYLQPIQSGKLKSYFKLGKRNCLKQGAEAQIKETLNGPSLGKAKILKIRRFKTWALDEKYFILNGFDWNVLRDFITQSNVARPEDYITVMDIEWIPATPAPLSCAPIALTHNLPASAQVRVSTEQARCAELGNLTRVVTLGHEGETIELLVRVRSRMNEPESNTVRLELERVSEGSMP